MKSVNTSDRHVRRRSRSFAFLTALLVGILLVPSPASAANPEIGNGVCNAANYCAYQLDAKGGSVADFRACEPDWYCGVSNLANWDYFNTNTSINDRTSSIWNRGSAYAYSVWAQHKNGGGKQVCFPSGSFVASATLNALDMNNKITSMWTSPTNDCVL